MSKITIIGLGLVGNSIGMGLRKSLASVGSEPTQIVGFDPDRSSEEAALRKYQSVHSIAGDLESAVQGAGLVIVSTPAAAVREVFEAIGPMLDEGAIVTDTLSIKEPVLAWAGELLSNRVSFVGGHPLSRTVDIETSAGAEPSADLFAKAPYCIIPLPSASSDALNTVITMAQNLGARPLFIDPFEHDSFFGAVSHLPILASAALLRITGSSPSWQDIGALARGQFGSIAEPLSIEPDVLANALLSNRTTLLHWIDQYLLALQDLREVLAVGDEQNLLSMLESAHAARADWLRMERASSTNEDPLAGRRVEMNEKLQAELNEAIEDSKPGRRILGRYLGDRMFKGREKQ